MRKQGWRGFLAAVFVRRTLLPGGYKIAVWDLLRAYSFQGNVYRHCFFSTGVRLVSAVPSL